MFIIFGLGNPGEKYKKTRHNVGFALLDNIRELLNFPSFYFNKKFNAEISEEKTPAFFGNIFSKKDKIVLVKPQTFMNYSGESVQKIMSFFKLNPKNIMVIHDDLDIPFGKYKISANSSSGGHNGVQSIIDHINSQDFIRIRIGIEKKDGRKSRKMSGKKFVLSNFSDEESKKINIISEEILSEIKSIIKNRA